MGWRELRKISFKVRTELLNNYLNLGYLKTQILLTFRNWSYCLQRLQISNIQFNCRLIWLKRKVEWELSDDIHLSLTGQINRLVMVEVLTPHSSLLFWFISCPTSKDQANRWYSTFHFRMKILRSGQPPWERLNATHCFCFLQMSTVSLEVDGSWRTKKC